jgi:uncharacterized coiled-coil protein SlyX
MRQFKVKPNGENIDFNDVAAVADRMVWTGRLPTLEAICEELNVRNTDKVGQYFALWRTGHGHNQSEKTHIADLPPELQHLLAEAFERRVASLTAKLNAESAEIQIDRDRLVKINEQQAAQITALMRALGDAEAKIANQEKRIAGLRKEIAAERDAHVKTEQRIRDAMQELTRVEHTLESPFPETSGGA